jgi:hypothetical protein
MSEGMKIKALTASGEIVIEAGEGSRRTYRWDGCTKSVKLRARTKRWFGSLGLYYDGVGTAWWVPCGGTNRAVIEEGQQGFETAEEALDWLSRRTAYEYVYTSDGLVIGWESNARRRALHVEVWQLLVQGNKPAGLAGAKDDRLVVEGVHSESGLQR